MPRHGNVNKGKVQIKDFSPLYSIDKIQSNTKIWSQAPPQPKITSHKSEAAVPEGFLSPPSLNISYSQSGPHAT